MHAGAMFEDAGLMSLAAWAGHPACLWGEAAVLASLCGGCAGAVHMLTFML